MHVYESTGQGCASKDKDNKYNFTVPEKDAISQYKITQVNSSSL